MKCLNCGAEIIGDKQFCPSCGQDKRERDFLDGNKGLIILGAIFLGGAVFGAFYWGYSSVLVDVWSCALAGVALIGAGVYRMRKGM